MSPRKPKPTPPSEAPEASKASEAEMEAAQANAAPGKAAKQKTPKDHSKDDAAAATDTANNRAKAAQADYEAHHEQPGKRRPADERADAFNTLAWLLDGASGVVEELRHSDLGLSEKFWVHAYAMRREGLLAARAAIDSLLEKSEEAEQAAQDKDERKSRRGGVRVDF